MSIDNQNGVLGRSVHGTGAGVGRRQRGAWHTAAIVAAAVSILVFVGAFKVMDGRFAPKIESIGAKMDRMEKMVTTYHGPEGMEPSEEDAASDDRGEGLEMLRMSLADKSKELDRALKNNSVLISALEKWAAQVDADARAIREKTYGAYVHITDIEPRREDVAVLNTDARIGGTVFKVGDRITLTNAISGRRESVTVKIVSSHSSLEDADVLVQVARKPAKTLGLTTKIGKMKVIVKRAPPEPGDENEWKTLPEMVEEAKAGG